MDKKRIIIALLDRVMKLQENGHYVSLQISNYGHDISIYAIKGGFKTGEFDFYKDLMLTDSDKLLSTLIQLDEIIEEWGDNNE